MLTSSTSFAFSHHYSTDEENEVVILNQTEDTMEYLIVSEKETLKYVDKDMENSILSKRYRLNDNNEYILYDTFEISFINDVTIFNNSTSNKEVTEIEMKSLIHGDCEMINIESNIESISNEVLDYQNLNSRNSWHFVESRKGSNALSVRATKLGLRALQIYLVNRFNNVAVAVVTEVALDAISKDIKVFYMSIVSYHNDPVTSRVTKRKDNVRHYADKNHSYNQRLGGLVVDIYSYYP